MSEIQRVKLSFEKTVQEDSYEPSTVSETLVVEVDEDETPEDVREEHYEDLKDTVKQRAFDLKIQGDD